MVHSKQVKIVLAAVAVMGMFIFHNRTQNYIGMNSTLLGLEDAEEIGL